MSKRTKRAKKQQKTAPPQKVLVAAIAIAVLIVAVAAIVFQGSDTSEPNVPTTDVQDVAFQPGLISPSQYVSGFNEPGVDHYLLDVRTPEEFAEGHIEGAVNINVEEIHLRYDEIPTDLPIVVYCRTGRRSGIASEMMAGEGFSNLYDIGGGIVAWGEAGLTLTQ
jgi:phage shock protein E